MQFFTEKWLTTLLRWGMYALPITLFLYIQTTLFPFVTLKLAVFQILAALLFALWLVLIVRYPQYRPSKNTLTLVVATFLVLLILSSLTAVNVNRALFSTPDRAIGVVALLHFVLLTLVLSARTTIVEWRRYVQYLFWVSVGMSIFAIIQRLAPNLFFVSEGSRPGGTLGNPQYLTGYLITNFFIGLWLLAQPMRSFSVRMWHLTGLAVLISAFILTNTRGAVIGLVIGLLTILVHFAYKKFRPFSSASSLYKNWALLTLAGIALLAGVFLLTKQSLVWQKIPVFDRLAQTSLTDVTTNNRLIVWRIAVDSIQERPFLGWGWDNFRYPFNARFEPALFATGSNESYWDKPHNILLEIAVATGIVGLLAYVYVLYLLGSRLARHEQFGVYGLAMVLAYVAQNMVSFDTFGSFFMFFALLGIAAQERSQRDAQGSDVVTQKFKMLPTSLAVIGGVIIAATSIVVTVQVFRANRANYNGMNYLAQLQNDPTFLSIGLKYFQDALQITQPYRNEVRESYISTLKQIVPLGTFPGAVEVMKGAISEMRQAIKTDPKNFFFYYALADAKNIFERLDKSLSVGVEDDLKKADQLSPRRQQIYYARSRAELLKGNMDGAIEAMRQAIELYPAAAEPHFYYALLLMDVKKYDEGIKELFEAGRLGRYPKVPAEARAVNTYLEGAGRFVDEINYFSDAIDFLNPTGELQFEYLLQLGKAYYGALSYANARLVFDDVLILAPGFRQNPRFEDEFAKIFTAIGL